jgi:ribosomal protein L37AE/L43A
MSAIDTRVVEMQFDNKKFGSGVKDSLNDLKNLKEGLKLDGATGSRGCPAKAASRFSLGIGQRCRCCGQKFSAMAVMGITALANLTNKVVNSATEMAKSLTIAPDTRVSPSTN